MAEKLMDMEAYKIWISLERPSWEYLMDKKAEDLTGEDLGLIYLYNCASCCSQFLNGEYPQDHTLTYDLFFEKVEQAKTTDPDNSKYPIEKMYGYIAKYLVEQLRQDYVVYKEIKTTIEIIELMLETGKKTKEEVLKKYNTLNIIGNIYNNDRYTKDMLKAFNLLDVLPAYTINLTSLENQVNKIYDKIVKFYGDEDTEKLNLKQLKSSAKKLPSKNFQKLARSTVSTITDKLKDLWEDGAYFFEESIYEGKIKLE